MSGAPLQDRRYTNNPLAQKIGQTMLKKEIPIETTSNARKLAYIIWSLEGLRPVPFHFRDSLSGGVSVPRLGLRDSQ
jgi:hypothetical protein